MTAPHTRADALLVEARDLLFAMRHCNLTQDDDALNDHAHDLIGRIDDARQTRLASPSDQSPPVSVLGAPGVPKEWFDLLAWREQALVEHPHGVTRLAVDANAELVRVEIGTGDAVEPSDKAVIWHKSFAEAARAALEKVSR